MRLDIIDSCLPASPVSAAVSLSASFSDDDGEDRISALPDFLLRNVVSRLPVKDGARTDALSRRWRGLWRATPLVLDDAHLVTDRPGVNWRAPAGAAVSRVLASRRARRVAPPPRRQGRGEPLPRQPPVATWTLDTAKHVLEISNTIIKAW